MRALVCAGACFPPYPPEPAEWLGCCRHTMYNAWRPRIPNGGARISDLPGSGQNRSAAGLVGSGPIPGILIMKIVGKLKLQRLTSGEGIGSHQFPAPGFNGFSLNL